MTGIFGGTFNPFHKGHYESILYILASYKPDRLYVIPAACPPHKEFGAEASDEDRLKMAKAAVSGLKNVTVSDIELRRGGKSYTIDTVTQLMERRRGSDICLFVGEDMLMSFELWHRAPELAKLCRIKALSRGGVQEERARAQAAKLSAKLGGDFALCDNPVVKISSTQIRDRLKAGEDCTEYLPEAVKDYIEKKGLYK